MNGRPPGSAGAGEPREPRELPDLGSRTVTPAMQASLLVGRTLMRCFTRLDVGPLDGLPADGPLIIASNHLSNADPALIASWLTPALGRAVQQDRLDAHAGREVADSEQPDDLVVEQFAARIVRRRRPVDERV